MTMLARILYAAVAGSLLVSSSVYAQLNRAYVSVASGNDTNSCSYSNPCRTIGKAVTVMNSGGEIILIDGGGFGPFTIDRALSIQAPQSVFAGVIAASGNAVTINATTDAVIALRGLTLTGVGADTGLIIGTAGSVHIEDMLADGFTSNGVRSQSASELFVRRLTSRNNGKGFAIVTHGAAVAASVSDSSFDSNSEGVTTVGADVSLLLRDSTLAGNSSWGVNVYSGANVVVEGCTMSHNAVALEVQSSGSIVHVSNSSFAYNEQGVKIYNAGVGYSRGNNRMIENTTNGTFTGTFTAAGSQASPW